MSLIETPPKDRIAVQTVVASWDEKLVRSAIEQELDRGGQVYFVHNRVDTIWEIAAKLQELAPRARIIVGHGQMSEGVLEKVMLKFMLEARRFPVEEAVTSVIPLDLAPEALREWDSNPSRFNKIMVNVS